MLMEFLSWTMSHLEDPPLPMLKVSPVVGVELRVVMKKILLNL